MSNFHVALKKVVDDSYDVQIGCGLIDDMIQDIKEGLVGNKKKFAVITDSNVDEVYGRPVLEKILAAGYQGDLFVFAAGEKSKVRKTKEEIEDAKREAKSELWAAETLARDNGKPWDVPTYNQERERVILDMSRRYSVAPEILFAFIPQRPDDEYSKGAIYIDSTHAGSAKNKARYLFNSLKSDIQKKAAVQIAIDDLWKRYGNKPVPVFEQVLKAYEENDAHTLKLVEDLEALVYAPDKK